jgi:vancomycin resistance protein YoaR
LTEHRTARIDESPTEASARRLAAARARRDRQRGADETSRPSWIAWTFAALALVGIMVVAVDALASMGRVHPGVTVAGVKVGGMTPAQATTVLQSRLPEKASAPVAVTYRGKTWPFTSEDLSASFDYPALVKRAMDVGRTSGLVGNLTQRVVAWFSPVALPAPATADPSKLDAALDTVTSAIDEPPKDATVALDGSTWSVKPAKSGMMTERDLLSRQLLAAFTSTHREVPATVRIAQAEISEQTAKSAKRSAESMIAESATILWGTKSWQISPAELRRMIAFRKVAPASTGASWTLEPYVAPKMASKIITPKLGNKVGHPARDARFKTHNGEVTVVPARVGVGPDIDTLASALTAAMKSPAGQKRIAQLHTRKTNPKLTTAAARAMNINDRISTFSTEYVASNKPRVNNIHTLGDALDGELVAPGATFSFNKAVGERTAAKGYQEAPAIVDGKLVPQLGGGICQVGTTLFNTVFFSGLPVVERHNHSFYISHYPKGRDATVSWGGPDLKFKNTTKHWLLLSVSYTSGSITMSLYGTDPGYTVAYKTGRFTNEKPFETQKVKDPKLRKGKEVVDDPGENGMTCVVTRTVKKDGELISTDVFKSVYRPKVEVLRVGTKAASSKATTDTVGSGN